MVNNRLHGLMLLYVRKNILDNINLVIMYRRQPQTNIRQFFTELLIMYIRLS